MTPTVTLVIPRKPPPTYNRLNKMHWAKRRDLKTTWEWEVLDAAARAGRPTFQRARIQIVLYYGLARRRDPDNLLGGAAKFLLDGLRLAKVIPDDDLTTIELPEVQVEIDRKNPRVEIEITSLDETPKEDETL